ncbi:monovalent cation:proton antiporter-2 (CPA2) family protein [Suttonella sp. R2A3]|uniref:monovalent cation:proton antiporter-2 (CPA2) family protein n=1 Tax=Suttonella sp. R2A3 TaxID=2908648 RepID=UPI001F3C1DBB|nr:monovalent cation:proton antiporter-2 (CPA2) family protein [Suttonella sp. R2A3]UJF24464.1 monovalent cation:proton antiporter-2 (CPA2) family protein [Suttonella sp. R2A3]
MNEMLFKFAVILLASIVVVPLAKLFKLGSVLGYLLAGVVIGPFLLGLLGTGDQQTLLHFSEFGVVMMLFIIGLEIKPSFLWRMRTSIMGLGGLQMLLSALAIAAIAMLFGQPWRSALVIGMVLGLSSTAIVIQTLSEKGLLNGRAGRSVFSVLLFQDIAVIPILAVMPFLAMSGPLNGGKDFTDKGPLVYWMSQQPNTVQFLLIIIAISAVIVLGRLLSASIFRWIAKMDIRDIFTATVLFFVIAVALLMEAVGLSAALGTFIAGVMLAESEYRHEVELSIEPFKSILLGLFFISVGASLDFNLFMDSPFVIATLVFALIGVKWVILYFLAKAFRHTQSQRLLFSSVLAQGGEFAFVLFTFAADNYVLDQALTDLLVLVVIVSMLLTPLMMLLLEFIERSKRLESQPMTREPETVDEHNQVIVAGYGRFNQIIARLLNANGHQCTIIDNNPEVIDLVKRFGQKVFYGDVTRHDLLKAAGADEAKLLIIGLKDREQIDLLITVARKFFPHLKIIVRAFDRVHAYHLIDQKVDYFQREQVSSALELGEKALIELGYHPYTAYRQARIFKTYDERMLEELYATWQENPHKDIKHKPGEQYISHSRELHATLEKVMRNDRFNRKLTVEHDHAWEPVPDERLDNDEPQHDDE